MANKKISDEEMKRMISELARPKTESIADSLPTETVNETVVETEHVHHSESAPNHKHDTDDLMNHGGHMMHMGNMKRKLIVSVILTVPIVLMSNMMGMNLPITLHNIPYQPWIVLVLGTIVFLYGGTPFFKGAWGELRHKKPAMMLLITLGIIVAYAYSLYATITNYLNVNTMINEFFWELVTLIDIMLLGHLIEMNAIMKAGSAVESLAKLIPKQAHRIDEYGNIIDIAVTELTINDEIVVRSGESIPVDGVVIAGETMVNEAMLTGEASQVNKKINDEVLGGAINGDGMIRIKVLHLGADSFLARVQRLVTHAQAQKSERETLADKVANRLFYAAIIIGILAFVIWLTINGLSYALPIAVTVFIIACPHALGLAVPLVTACFTSLAAQNGLLIQHRQPLEQVNDIKYALMDKTGTLTEGKFKIRSLKTISAEYSDSDILAIMATLENESTHPLAQGIIALAKNKHISLMQATEVETIPGVGVTGVLNNQRFALVAVNYLVEHAISFDQEYVDKLADAGNSVSFLVTTGKVVGIVAQGDEIKPTVVKFIRELKQLGITPVMLTGDNPHTASRVAKSLEIEEFKAQLKPADKAVIVKEYQAKGAVMMIGDGVNDSPALAQADLGIAIGSGTDVAIDAADVVLVKSNPADILKLLSLAKATNKKVQQNLWWGAGYNVIALPLAAGILIPFGFKLDPMIGAILMSLSTIIVAINAMRLRIK